MQQIAYFIQKYKYFLFFLFLSFIAIVLTINNNTFHKSKFISSANSITGGLYDKSSQISEYFHLKEMNETLISENKKLRNQLELIRVKADSTTNSFFIDTTKYQQKYFYTTGKIIKNNYHKQNNFITINRGENDSIFPEMAVINSKGIIGITDNTTSKYARVQSILNTNSKINARLKNSFHFGTLIWNGKDYNTVQLTDIPRQAIITVGDTIITGGKSTIFPEGIQIGTIKNINKSTHEIDIKLFNDMSNLNAVYIVKNFDKIEIDSLKNNTNE